MASLADLPERIATKIHVNDATGCWEWTAALGSAGYGKVHWEGKVREAHRVVYELLIGPIAPGLVIDHLCHTDACEAARIRSGCIHRRCQRPEHLFAVTQGANVLRGIAPHAENARKTHCDNGHEYTAKTTTLSEGHRRCLLCRREADHRRRPAGVPLPRRAGVRPFYPNVNAPEAVALDARVVGLRRGGMTFAAIALELGISTSSAHKRYHRRVD